MKSPRCLRIALVVGGLTAGWLTPASEAEAGLFNLFGCRDRQCSQPVYYQTCTCSDSGAGCLDCADYPSVSYATYCGDTGRVRGRRTRRQARRCARIERRQMRQACGSGRTCATVVPTYCGAPATCCDDGCGSAYVPGHAVSCGRRAARAARRCQRRANRQIRRASRFAGCETRVAHCGTGCVESSPCHVSSHGRRRVRGAHRVRCRRAACCATTCHAVPSHRRCGAVRDCFARVRGRRHCRYGATCATGYGYAFAPVSSGCVTSESDSHPLPQHEAPVDQTAPVDGAAPVDQQQNQEAGSNLPLPPSEEGAAEQAPTEDVPLPQAPKGPAALRIPTFR